jgi:hypothetical protein
MIELDYTPVDAYVDLGELITDGTKALIDAMAGRSGRRFGSVVTAVATNDAGVTVDAGRRVDARGAGRDRRAFPSTFGPTSRSIRRSRLPNRRRPQRATG